VKNELRMTYDALRFLPTAILSAFVLSAGAAPIDPAVRSAPLWDCSEGRGEMVLWRAHVGSYSGPISLSDGKLFVGAAVDARPEGPEGATMACLDDNGKVLWRAIHPRVGQRVHDMGQAIQSKPLVEGKTVYYVSNRGELMCVDAEGFIDGTNNGPFQSEKAVGPTDADILWKIDMMSQLGVYKREAGDVGNPVSSPIIMGDLVYCVTGHGRSAWSGGFARAAPEPASFLAADKLTGKVAWTSSAPGTNIIYSQWSSAVQADVAGIEEVIFPGGDGFLYGFEARSGKLLWRFDCNEKNLLDHSEAKTVEDSKNFFVAAPVVRNGVLYVGLNKSFEMPSPAPLLAIELPPKHGRPRLKWKFGPAGFGTYTSAAIADDIVFVTSGEEQPTLFALNAADGGELWRATLPEGRNLFASPVVRFGKVFAGDDSTLTVFAAGPKKRCYGYYQFGASYLSTPVVTYDRIYVAANGFVWAVRLPWE